MICEPSSIHSIYNYRSRTLHRGVQNPQSRHGTHTHGQYRTSNDSEGIGYTTQLLSLLYTPLSTHRLSYRYIGPTTLTSVWNPWSRKSICRSESLFVDRTVLVYVHVHCTCGVERASSVVTDSRASHVTKTKRSLSDSQALGLGTRPNMKPRPFPTGGFDHLQYTKWVHPSPTFFV